MATIGGAVNERVYSIPRWLGLNEHPDGDTRLKLGEASEMVNWKVTRDGNLKRRPGTEFVAGLNVSYVPVISGGIREIGTFKSGDYLMVYDEVSAMVNPGTPTPIGSGGALEQGVLVGVPASIKRAIWKPEAPASATISSGVLTITGGGGTAVTVEDLMDVLDSLEPGEYVIIRYNELVWALEAGAIVEDKGRYAVSGYVVRAVPGEVVEGETVFSDPQPVACLWAGLIAGKEHVLAACDGKLWNLYDPDTDTFSRSAIGSLNTDNGVSIIPFNGIVYLLNGTEYYQYDGTNLTTVEGYRPLVAIAIAPDGTSGTTTGEYVNKLNGERRVWISPNGSGKTFQLPESGTITVSGSEVSLIKQIDWVKNLATGATVPTTDYTYNLTNGTVTFNTAPAQAVNSYEIAYTVRTTMRSQVTGMLFGELYSGTTDNRIFIYGDGTNRALYSGMDYDGQARADYFPDLYELSAGDSNTPITALIRHYGDLVCYKTDSTWVLKEGTMELMTGDIQPAIYCTPVNKDKGNVAPGQVCLVDNNPVTASGQELYHWINSSYYSSELSRDERQARRISDRIQSSIKEIDLPHACMLDDNDNQEFYICSGGIALVWNYVADAWYRYENINAVRMCAFHGEVLFGTVEGKVLRLSYYVKGDEGDVVKAKWVSGAIDFGADYQRKYSSMMWVGLKPEEGTSVDVSVITDRKNTFRDKVVSSEKAKVPGQPFVVKTKIKAKKFVFYRLELMVNEKMPAPTVTNVDFRVRQTGYSK